MSLKVKAKERLFKVGKYAGEYRYVMMPELYSALSQDKVIREAALRSGVSEGVMKACWDAAGEVIKAWLPEGHSIPIRYDRNGQEVKRVTSTDDGTVEEPDNGTETGENDGGNTGDNTQNGGGENTNVNPNPNQGGGGGDEPGADED